MKKIIRLTESDLVKLVKKVITEQSEHTKNLYKSWAKKKSGNEEGALSIMDNVFQYLNKLPKKDFAKYTSYEELKNDLDKVMGVQMGKDKSSNVDKLYEDSELLVVAPKTWEASCKYGAGSKWCTTSKDTSSYWQRHNTTGTEFFWIFKNKPESDTGHKFSYHIKISGQPDWCDAINQCSSKLSDKSYPKQHPKFDEIIIKLQEYHDKRPNLNKITELNEKFIFSMLNNVKVGDFISDDYLKGLISDVADNYKYNIEKVIKEYESEKSDGYYYDDEDDDEEEYYDEEEDYIEYDFKSIKNELSNIVLKKFLKRGIDIIKTDLSFLITKVIVEKYNLSNDVVFENQPNIEFDIYEILNELPENELTEVLFENLSEVFHNELTQLPEIGQYF